MRIGTEFPLYVIECLKVAHESIYICARVHYVDHCKDMEYLTERMDKMNISNRISKRRIKRRFNVGDVVHLRAFKGKFTIDTYVIYRKRLYFKRAPRYVIISHYGENMGLFFERDLVRAAIQGDTVYVPTLK